MSTFWKRDDAGRLSFPGGNGGYDVFVETGTNLGETLAEAAKVFQWCHTVEVDPMLFQRVRSLYIGNDHIALWNGDSAACMSDIVGPDLYKPEELMTDHKVMFWLDAHATDGDSPGPQCPLLAELQSIVARTWKHTPLILIDDAQCFGAKEPMFRGHRPAEWPTLDQITNVLFGGARWSTSIEGKVIVCRPR